MAPGMVAEGRARDVLVRATVAVAAGGLGDVTQPSEIACMPARMGA